MARGVNKAILVGNLGKDPEVSYLPSGQSVTKFSLATSRSYKDKNGELKDETEWHNIVAWGKLGEICAQYLAKGRQAYVEGRIQTRSWEGRDGNKRYTTEIIAENVQMLGGRGEGPGEPVASRAPAAARNASPPDDGSHDPGPPDITDDDIPF